MLLENNQAARMSSQKKKKAPTELPKLKPNKVLNTCDRANIMKIIPIWPRGGVMVKAMNCGIVVREFVLQSRYYVHFRANTLGKGMNPLILPPAMDK